LSQGLCPKVFSPLEKGNQKELLHSIGKGYEIRTKTTPQWYFPMNVATTTCTVIDSSTTECVTPQGSLTGNVSFQLNILIFLGLIMFTAFLFNGFGGGRRRT